MTAQYGNLRQGHNPYETVLTPNKVANGLSQPSGYFGYFLKPLYDSRPADGIVGFPGGSVQVTSNNGSNAVVWALANVGEGVKQSV